MPVTGIFRWAQIIWGVQLNPLARGEALDALKRRRPGVLT
jgi:hypothetical protein